MSSYQQVIEAALRAVTIHSPTGYSWFGKRAPEPTRSVRQKLTPRTARAYLLAALAAQLYRDCYLRGSPAPPAWEAPAPTPGVTPFAQALSAANRGRGCWEGGWEVRAVAAGEVLLHRAGLTLRARPEECRAADAGPLAPGARVQLRLPKEFFRMAPGFYAALGDSAIEPDAAEPLVRLYWNLRAAGAVALVGAVTARLNDACLPFRLKVLDDPARFTRCDAAVLYVPRGCCRQALALLGPVYRDLAGHVKASTPAFTKPLAPGLGLAEDHGDERSFGEHRCRLLAEAMARAHEQGCAGVAERLDVVVACFAEAGVRLDAPYLNPGSRDDYQFAPVG